MSVQIKKNGVWEAVAGNATNTSGITESSALSNIGTSANATQHDINVAIDSALEGELLSITFAPHVKGSAIRIGKLVIVTIETESGFSVQAYESLVSGLPTCTSYTYNTITKTDGSVPKNLYITTNGTFIGSTEAMSGDLYRGQLIYVCN